MFKFRKEITYNEKIPKFYGACFRKPGYLILVCYPIPFNLIIYWLRQLWHLIKTPIDYPKIQRLKDKIKSQESTIRSLREQVSNYKSESRILSDIIGKVITMK